VNPHIRPRGRRRVRASIAVAIIGVTTTGASLASATGLPTASENSYSNAHISVRQHILSGGTDPVSGYVKPGRRGRVVWVQARRHDGTWGVVARDKTDSKGRFRTSWRPNSIAHYDVRLVLPNTGGTRRADGGVTVYRASAASWYGPGFYGHRTACGGTLSAGTLGVAHKTLPCGTDVRFYYRGHTVTAPVIDRGPYAGGREYDLTQETKNRLHFGSTGTVWSSPSS
jgi:peptidoglycan lytic transglycosylase